jgi:hypothetical protein
MISLLSLLWKEAQQEVRQHWFITGYIAAYIQGLYKGVRVHKLVWPSARGVARSLHFTYYRRICDIHGCSQLRLLRKILLHCQCFGPGLSSEMGTCSSRTSYTGTTYTRKLVSKLKLELFTKMQCCGSGAARSRNFLPEPVLEELRLWVRLK